MLKVPFGAAFPHENVHSEPQFLAGLLQFRALVIRAHAGERIGVQILPAQPGRMPIDHFAFARLDLGQLALEPEKHARVIHQFRDARDAFVRDHEPQIIRRETRARRLQMVLPERKRAA